MVTPELVEITPNDLLVRANWIQTMQSRTGLFLDSTAAAEAALEAEIAQNGASPLLAHLRLCGTIPESFGHDSSEEKLYSKYTDAVLCETFRFLGMRSLVLAGRADCADVEAFSSDHSFDLVADAKVFRLSRTAKNAKDFKVASMNRWKYGKKYATVVCPIISYPPATVRFTNRPLHSTCAYCLIPIWLHWLLTRIWALDLPKKYYSRFWM